MITVQPYQPQIYNNPAFKGHLEMNSSLRNFVEKTPDLERKLGRIAEQAGDSVRVFACKAEDGFINGTNADIFVENNGKIKKLGRLEITDRPQGWGDYSTEFYENL